MLIAANCFAAESHNFNDIKAAVANGKNIRLVIDFEKCSTPNNLLAESRKGVFTPNEMQITDDHIAASLMHFTLNHPNFLGKPIYEYSRYTITADNLEFNVQPLDAITYAPLAEKFSVKCKLDAAVKVYL